MSFNPDKITREHIIKASEIIDSQLEFPNESIGYDVIINNKKYPPKEIIRLSNELATGKDSELVYGSNLVNFFLKEKGFEIIRKNSIWKLGCNWGKGAPSFYNLLKNNNLLITVEEYKYKIGDLVLITEGFTVLAIAKVLEEPKNITAKKELNNINNEYKIPFENYILCAKAEFYILPKIDVFTYELQQGIRKIQSNQIIDKAIDIWDNKNFKLNKIRYYVKEYNEKSESNWTYPCFVLEPKSWDDYTFKTSFDLYYYRDLFNRVDMGFLKIMQKKSTTTILKKEFNQLTNNYCSLGQSIEFYMRIKNTFPDKFYNILNSLNDCNVNYDIRKEFERLEGFTTSLLRTSESFLIYNKFDEIIKNRLNSISYNFIFNYQIDDALQSHIVNFNFNTDKYLPNRLFCVVGKNATGKTKYITQLANKLADDNEQGNFDKDRPYFSKIITASFSFFDKFRFPKREDLNYTFIGIRDRNGIIDETKYSDIVWKSYRKINEDPQKKELWLKSINSSLETDYINFDLVDLFKSNRSKFIEKTENIFSSGQNIIFQFITRFIESIEYNSLLIFDEPETHLHPNIAGRLIRTINNILEDYNSFCILSTHSPVIVQEIPSKYIRIFDRQDNYPLIYNPIIECFGENLSIISNSIFKVDEEKELYKQQLELLSKKMTYNEINNLFDNSLSLNARLYLQTIQNMNK